MRDENGPGNDFGAGGGRIMKTEELELLTYEDIGRLWKYSARYVRDKIMKDRDAPLPIQPGRYAPEDIKRFRDVLKSRSQRGCNRSSRASGPSSQTSGTDQEH